MLLQKTEKARLELSPGVRTLSLRERSLLLLADGKPLSDLQAMYNGIGAQIVENLMRQGYLTGPAALPPAPEPTTSNTIPTSTPSIERPAPGESLRSLAGARMYLFDTCERLFARRDPVAGAALSGGAARRQGPHQHAGCGRGHVRGSRACSRCRACRQPARAAGPVAAHQPGG